MQAQPMEATLLQGVTLTLIEQATTAITALHPRLKAAPGSKV
jgi:hypothetical protein